MSRRLYEIRVRGSIGPAARQAFTGLVIDEEPPTTVLTGQLSQEGLHSLLERTEALGLEVLEIREGMAPFSPADPPGAHRNLPQEPDPSH